MGTSRNVSELPMFLSWQQMASRLSPPSSLSSKTTNKADEPTDESNNDDEQSRGRDNEEGKEDGFAEMLKGALRTNSQVRLALYIALAHAGLALFLALVYTLFKLLEEYWRPIRWAILCSIPLREIQRALVQFWTHPLQLGLLETLLAVPVALARLATATIIDSQVALMRFLPQRHRLLDLHDDDDERIGFSKLIQWMVSFGLFVFANERFGISAIPMFAFVGFMAYAAGSSVGFVEQRQRRNVAAMLSAISFARRSRSGSRRTLAGRISRYLTSGLLHRLRTVVGIGLISFMMFGSFVVIVFFSYKIGVEGKDAVLSVKSHLQTSNYAERIGLTQWLDDNDVPKLIDAYTSKFYESLYKQIDHLALQYNATEIVEGIKHNLIKPLEESFTFTAPPTVSPQPFTQKLHNLRMKVQNKDWRVLYGEIGLLLRELLALVSREDLIEKIRDFVLQSVDVSKRLFASSTVLLFGSANLVFGLAVSIVSGAAGVFNFISQLMVFFWLLYYLITSESGGVLYQMLGMLPIPQAKRVRCADVLGLAVSTVLLATAKIAVFQGCLTYLLFRFYHIHFLYTSTFLAFTSAFLPVTPPWVSSILAASQLAVERRYVEALILIVIHHTLINFGVNAIQVDVPEQSAYLTGMSILGGMVLLPSALEGAVMGPLVVTVIVALKNLYTEFVLTPAKKRSEIYKREHSVARPLRKSLALNILLTMQKFHTSGKRLDDGLDCGY